MTRAPGQEEAWEELTGGEGGTVLYGGEPVLYGRRPADKALIAAAPEMAELLGDVRYDLQNEGFVSNETGKRVHALLSRIRGEASERVMCKHGGVHVSETAADDCDGSCREAEVTA